MEIFEYDFMIKAFIIGLFSAIITSLFGNFLVASRQSMISDMIAHSSLAGVGIGIFFHISPYSIATITSIISSSILFYFNNKKKTPPEAISMMILTGGVAIAILFSHLSKNNPLSLDSFLFGSILTTTTNEIYILFIILILSILFILFFWKRLIGIFFDKEFTKTKFKNSWAVEWIFFVLLGLIISFSLKTIGALLIGALLIIPVLTAQNFANRFIASIIYSLIINIFGVFIGIITSFYFDIPTSSAIVLTLITIFLISNFFKYSIKK